MSSFVSSSVPWLRLAHKTAIVTGAASGIGAAVATALAHEHGCLVIAADRNASRLQEAVPMDTVTRTGTIIPVTCNVSSEKEVQELFRQQQHALQEASVLVNCAGITRDSLCTSMTTDQHWQPVLDVNLTGTFLMCREFLKLQQHTTATTTSTSTPRCIVNVGSVVSEGGKVGQANYAASKGGVLGLTRALAKEYASKRVRVNAVLPGFIDTEMVQAIPDKVKNEHILPKVGMGRYGRPEDVANLILFLASEERSGFITGECIECSGMISL